MGMGGGAMGKEGKRRLARSRRFTELEPGGCWLEG